MRYATDSLSASVSSHPPNSTTEPESSPSKSTALVPSANPLAATTTTGDDGLPHQQKNILCHAHSRVLLAVCELIIYSPVVASYVLSMPGARAIVKSSCLLHQSSKEIGSSVMGCLQVLQKESQRIYEQVSSHRHSLSYELTHGRSSKLFNPVAVLAKRDGPSPRLLSRPSTSSATGVGTTFGLPRAASFSQPSIHRSLSSRYSTSMNPFTTEFSLPSTPQPHSPHSPTPGGSGEYDPDRYLSKGVDILYVHHDTEDGEDEGEEDVFDTDRDGGFDLHPSAARLDQRKEQDQPEVQDMFTNLPFLSQKHPQGQSSSNQSKVRNEQEGMINASDEYLRGEQQGDPSDQEERNHSVLGRNRIVYNPPESPPRRGLKDHQGLSFPHLRPDSSSCSWHRSLSPSRSVPFSSTETSDARSFGGP